jgi:hypothetical protein
VCARRVRALFSSLPAWQCGSCESSAGVVLLVASMAVSCARAVSPQRLLGARAGEGEGGVSRGLKPLSGGAENPVFLFLNCCRVAHAVLPSYGPRDGEDAVRPELSIG